MHRTRQVTNPYASRQAAPPAHYGTQEIARKWDARADGLLKFLFWWFIGAPLIGAGIAIFIYAALAIYEALGAPLNA